MSEDELGFAGAAAIGLGGMIGGGVFSVLGVVVSIAGGAAWLAFTAASLVSMCAAYSYIKLNELGDEHGGSVTQIEQFLGNRDAAGMVGWTLLVGYVGAIAVYAFAFGGFAVELSPAWLREAVPLPLRPTYSVFAVALFVVLNVVGARATGASEKVLVGLKLVVLFGVSAWGLWYGATHDGLSFGFGRLDDLGLVTATAVSFVSFQGWQLLVYDYGSVRDPEETIPKAIYTSIVGAIVIDSMVAILVTSTVATDVIRRQPEIAVARAVEPFLGSLGFVFVAVAALFSTGSAINGTLFSSAHFAKGMLADGLIPDRAGSADADGAPERTLLVIGALAAAFTAYGSLDAITSFGSLAFMVVFGVMSFIAFTKRDAEGVNGAIPAVGVLGTGAFFPLLVFHLYTAQREVFWSVLAVAVVVVAVELLYFEGERMVSGARSFERALDARLPGRED
ncbi:APC family permease [Halosegnis marinus]|uniref:APC family permease n=1 Tax=Halosegnis marinus TaxID=3034023 RepID=A0ABD5ZQT7_9EURY|nr:APC family permease [Halosegnis sp. DT85]